MKLKEFSDLFLSKGISFYMFQKKHTKTGEVNYCISGFIRITSKEKKMWGSNLIRSITVPTKRKDISGLLITRTKKMLVNNSHN
jgi:hypothetical protein